MYVFLYEAKKKILLSCAELLECVYNISGDLFTYSHFVYTDFALWYISYVSLHYAKNLTECKWKT